jgi:hypothetical protein
MQLRGLAVLALVALGVATGCGGGGGGSTGGSGSGGGGGSGGDLVASVDHAKAALEGRTVTATTEVKIGGVAGRHLTLRWGLIDAVSGVRASEEERVAGRYTTSKSVAKHDVTIHFAKPSVPTDYLVHFALYAPDGSFLASADSNVFTVK